MTPPALIVVMGVAGSGKTTVGSALAERLSLDFVDADGLHPAFNIATMAAGVPLTDEDRWPWLDEVGLRLRSSGDGGLVMACSALKRTYRDRIRRAAPGTIFLQLSAGRDVLSRRMEQRRGHFMPVGLLDSQLETLEPLQVDEVGAVIDVSASPKAVIEAASAAALSVLQPAPAASTP